MKDHELISRLKSDNKMRDKTFYYHRHYSKLIIGYKNGVLCSVNLGLNIRPAAWPQIQNKIPYKESMLNQQSWSIV